MLSQKPEREAPELMRLFLLLLLGALGIVGPPGVLAYSVSGNGKQTFRVTPERLILGPLAYGEVASTVLVREVKIEGASASTSVQNIDLSHAPGVTVMDRFATPDSLTLRLKIKVAQFTASEPYGILIKRPVRLETTSSEEPQLLFTVVGWTSFNKTSRNFNDYLFSGHERWQGRWGTPNLAGSLLAPFLLLALGSAAALFSAVGSRQGGLRLGGIVLLFGLCGALLALLAVTYSRGAWIAFVGGAMVLLFSARLRRFVLGALLVFVFLIFLLPSGLQRIDSYRQIQEDPSIAHRLELWTGALQMMRDHPWGVGANQFGPIFERDYQRFDHVALNTTAVSDYFTLGAERGVVFLSVALGSLCLVLFSSVRAARLRDNPWQLTLSSAFLAILVASAFSTLWFVPDYQRLFGVVAGGLLICLFVQSWRDGNRKILRLLALQGVLVFGWALILQLVALASLTVQPTRSLDISLNDAQGHLVAVHQITPRWLRPKGVIVYFLGERDQLSVVCHSTLRPLAALGWEVWTPHGAAPHDIAALAASARPRQPVFVAGQKEGGRLAWSAACDSSGSTVRAGAGLDFLTMDMDSWRGGTSLQRPFLVFHFIYEDQVSANAAIRVSRHTAFSGLPLTVQLSPEEPAAFSAGTEQWVQVLDHYLSAHAGP